MIDDKNYCLKVAVPLSVTGTFFYKVPDELRDRANIGCRVLVPFGKRKLTGYILEKTYIDNGLELKDIIEVLDPDSVLPVNLVKFLEWISEYYYCPIGLTIKSILPGGLSVDSYKKAYLTEEGLEALINLPADSKQREYLEWIKNNRDKKINWPLARLSGLLKKNWITIKEGMKKNGNGQLMRKFVKPANGIDIQIFIDENIKSLILENEKEFFEYLSMVPSVQASELVSCFRNGRYLLSKWVKKGILQTYMSQVFRDPAGMVLHSVPVPEKLNDFQESALSHIKSCLDGRTFHACLLYGVTGSGKTEVYFKAVQHAISLKQQAIIIVPEISLAAYMEGLFAPRMCRKAAIYHSGLSQGEQHDQWELMARGGVDLVIGARSALFAPLPDLGLIIVDEEHDSAYKQDSSPRYQGRDSAVMRAKIENAVLILGSATPSVQSYRNCLNGRYTLLSMPERVEQRSLPDIEVVDMKLVAEKNPFVPEIMSDNLRQGIEDNLKTGNQSLLFLNRRGYHSMFICRGCGESVRCPSCDVALSYHLSEDRLICHYCGYAIKPLTVCPACKRNEVKAYGFGTEKLELELQKLFPGARIARMDTDSTRRKGEALSILKRFRNHEIDILVGTQMITKGYDFPMVTLVGVISADVSLSFPDFRAGERTFQILSQVAGRAGRGIKKGKVYIQTFNPGHYAVKAAINHDYTSFYEHENALRAQLRYPPYSFLALLKFKGSDKEKTREAAGRTGQRIRSILAGWPERGKDIQVMGPVDSTISKIKGKYRCQILIKSRSISLLRYLLNEIWVISKDSRDVQVIIEMDPYQML